MDSGLFQWDNGNKPKVKRHGITPDEAMDAMLNKPLFIHDQQSEEEEREVYYGETRMGRMIAIVVTVRGEQLRVVTAYNLDADQKRHYLKHRSAEQL